MRWDWWVKFIASHVSFIAKSNSENCIKIRRFFTKLQTKICWLRFYGSRCRSRSFNLSIYGRWTNSWIRETVHVIRHWYQRIDSVTYGSRIVRWQRNHSSDKQKLGPILDSFVHIQHYHHLLVSRSGVTLFQTGPCAIALPKILVKVSWQLSF